VAPGLLMMNALKPGHRLDTTTREKIEQQFAKDVEKQQNRSGEVRAELSKGVLPWLVDTFMPANLLQAVVGSDRGRIGDVLPLILFALLIGAAGTTLREDQRATLQHQLELIVELMTRLVGWALQLAPFAVAAMMASTTINLGLQYLGALGYKCVFIASDS
jgi:DAACS family dicarboxylate/amino acid:cation (Na+ or H+) symporter